MGVVRCDPGRNERAPLLAVHFSSAIQNPRAEGGSVYCGDFLTNAFCRSNVPTRNVLQGFLYFIVNLYSSFTPKKNHTSHCVQALKKKIIWITYECTPETHLLLQFEFVWLSPLTEALMNQVIVKVLDEYIILPIGSWWNFKSRTRALIRSFSSVTLRNTGSNSCNATHWISGYGGLHEILVRSSPWPILLTAFCFSLRSLPSESTASSSRKYRLRVDRKSIR